MSTSVSRISMSDSETSTSDSEMSTSTLESSILVSNISTSESKSDISTSESEISMSEPDISTSDSDVSTSDLEMSTSYSEMSTSDSEMSIMDLDISTADSDISTSDISTSDSDVSTSNSEMSTSDYEISSLVSEMSISFSNIPKSEIEIFPSESAYPTLASSTSASEMETTAVTCSTSPSNMNEGTTPCRGCIQPVVLLPYRDFIKDFHMDLIQTYIKQTEGASSPRTATKTPACQHCIRQPAFIVPPSQRKRDVRQLMYINRSLRLNLRHGQNRARRRLRLRPKYRLEDPRERAKLELWHDALLREDHRLYFWTAPVRVVLIIFCFFITAITWFVTKICSLWNSPADQKKGHSQPLWMNL